MLSCRLVQRTLRFPQRDCIRKIGWSWVKRALINAWDLLCTVSFSTNIDPDPVKASHSQYLQKNTELNLRRIHMSGLKKTFVRQSATGLILGGVYVYFLPNILCFYILIDHHVFT
jgi:hypothetical protein